MKRLALYHKGTLYEQSEKSTTLIPKLVIKENFIKVLNVIKKKIHLNENDLIITLFSGYTNQNVKSIRRYITSNNINKIYFFIEDVFRLECQETMIDILDTYSIEKFPNTTRAIELDIIKNIIKKTNAHYEIYHCEYNSTFFENQHGIKIKYFDWFSTDVICYSQYQEKLVNLKFEKKISCFNLRKEIHRYLISILLQNFKDVIVTCNFRTTDEELINNQTLPLNSFNQSIKEKILENHRNINYNNLTWDIKEDAIYKNTWIDVSPQQQWENLSVIAKSFVNLVTETRFASPMPCFNEKTLKPIIVHKPFILLAPPGTLALLKKLGIKTFDRWWDESYDNITDHVKRFEAVYNICLDILNKPNSELEIILSEMSDVLNHNFKVLKSIPEKMIDLN